MFFVYNSMFLYGFVNYVFGLGMFFISLNFWLRWRTCWTLARYGTLAVLVLLTYLSHLTAYGFLAVALVVVSATESRPTNWRHVVQSFILLVPEALLFVGYRHPHAGGTSWGTLQQKFIGVLPLLLSYDYGLDVCVAVILLALGVYCLRRSGRMKLFRPCLGVGVAFLVLYALSPHEWIGGSPVDSRFVPPAIVLVVLAIQPQFPRATARVLFTLCFAILGCRLVMITRAWVQLSKQIASQIELFREMPENATLYPVFLPAHMVERNAKLDRVFKHVAEYATTINHAFVPTQLAVAGQENLLFRNSLTYHPPGDSSNAWIDSMRRYDFVWSFDPAKEVEDRIRDNCDFMDSSNGFSLWRVRK
jgi:hypothetical protein